MISIGSQSGRVKYGIKHYILDSEEDFKKLQNKNIMGCTCFVIDTSKYYMIDSKKQWIEITPFGKATSSEGGDIDNDGIPDDIDPSLDIIYEGGII